MISILIKSLIKIYIKYCQKLDFEAFPEYSNEKLNNKHKHIKLGIWDPKKKQKQLQVSIYFVNRGLNPLFHHLILLLILNYHN